MRDAGADSGNENATPTLLLVASYPYKRSHLVAEQNFRQRSAVYVVAGRTIMRSVQGKHSVWFKTPVGEGAGVVEFGPEGKLSGGDTTFAYAGNWMQEGRRFKATLSARRVNPGPPGVFGVDEIDIIVTGQAEDGESISCTGFAKQAPGLKLDVELIRMDDDEEPRAPP